ncbi:MAG: hypothetical protein FWD17_01975 [Polyangiaceae bacterium]|nr:hypothetical protein [Polyangiaceae bacterium]
MLETRNRPKFARAYPRDPELDALVEAFARGDYGTVRSRAPRLAESASDGPIRLAARALLARTRPDPLAVVFLALSAALLLALGSYWMANGRAGIAPLAPLPAVER